MSDFNETLKYLDVIKSRSATSDDLALSSSLSNPSKYIVGPTKSRAIKKIHYTLTVPAKIYTTAQLNALQAYPGRMIFQYNIGFSQDFYILDFKVDDTIANVRGLLLIKWRVGTTVYRYRLAGVPKADGFQRPLEFPDYVNQKIGKYCCFEYWTTPYTAIGFPYNSVGIMQNITYTLSVLLNPSYAEETSRNLIISSAALEPSNLGFTLPVALPITQDNISWASN